MPCRIAKLDGDPQSWRQEFEKVRQPWVVHREAGRQLNQEHAETGAEPSQAFDHPRDPVLRAEQSAPVRQRPRRLDAQDKAVGQLLVPSPEPVIRRPSVIAGVQLGRTESRNVVIEATFWWDPLRIENPCPVRVAPTGGSDVDGHD